MPDVQKTAPRMYLGLLDELTMRGLPDLRQRVIDTLQGFHDYAAQLEKALNAKQSGREPFNGLTAAEAERLALLVEEMGEAAQMIGKIMRHGYESRHPNGGDTNRALLERELGDVRHCMIRLCAAGDLSKESIHRHADAKAVNVRQYLHHQDDAGAELESDTVIYATGEFAEDRMAVGPGELGDGNGDE